MSTTINDGASSSQPQPPKERPARLARSAGVVSLAVMGSRVLGLVREQVFAAFFGASREYDAFLTAFRIPNLLRDLFAEGALSTAFVTTFSQTLEKKGEAEAWRLANLVLNALLIILSVITIIGIIIAPYIVDWIAPGFRAVEGKTELTITMTRIMFPFLLMVALAAVAMGILNAKNVFGIPASASTFFNIGSIVGGLLCAYLLAPEYTGEVLAHLLGRQGGEQVYSHLAARAVIGISIGTLIGGMLQFLIQVPSLRAVGYYYRPILSFSDAGVKQVMALMGPAIIGASAAQVNVFVNSNFASYLGDGPVSWLAYAFRFMQFPIGVFGVAIGTVTLPAISRSIANKNIPEFRNTLSQALGLVFLLCIPSAVGLIILAEPIIGAIYQHGRFTAFDTQQTAAALSCYALGLAGYAAIKVLAPAFYALNDARTPMLISLGSIATNFVLNWTFVRVLGLGHRGLAFSTSLVIIINFALLLILMRRRISRIEGRRLARSLVKISLASTAMALCCWLISSQIASFAGNASLLMRIINLGASISVGVVVLYVACRLLRVEELEMAVTAVAGRLRKRR